MARLLFFFFKRPSRAFPSYKNWTISTNSLGTASTLNKWASGRSSSVPDDSSLVCILDKFLGSTFV